ncbi:unnamed protein product [Heligmosomoides polygyrus]|uniref:Secreted protein n=1 Tax=Heligmosomoides polygyrus TaxID=6339 RepID=A0A183FLQ2_HELPZ|nr:unnamed protein product [Heligmosomoides polygyrus]
MQTAGFIWLCEVLHTDDDTSSSVRAAQPAQLSLCELFQCNPRSEPLSCRSLLGIDQSSPVATSVRPTDRWPPRTLMAPCSSNS